MIRLHLTEKKTLLGVTLLLALLTGLAYAWYYAHRDSSPAYSALTEEEAQQTLELAQDVPQSTTTAARPFPFNPNQADSLTLIRVGLPGWQVHNLLKYRRKGGRWRSADDFRRLYGLTDEAYRRLRPYLRIAPEAAANASNSKRNTAPTTLTDAMARKETLPEHWVKRTDKYAEGTVLALNEADTTSLKHIPGIGSYYAGKIVRYREALGGFIRLSQLEEIEGLPTGITRWFTLAPHSAPRRRNLNQCTFKELVRHPYLSYEQVKDIFNHRRHYGPIRSWDDLRLFPHFTDADFERLRPYFTLE